MIRNFVRYVLPILLLASLAYLGYWKFEIHRTVAAVCETYEGQEEWIGCAAQVALDHNDAEYCWAGGVFSPFTGSCMFVFASEVEDQAACETIFKPKYQKICTGRFN